MKKLKSLTLVKRRNLSSILFLFLSLNGAAQVNADPATGQMDITDQSGVSLNANFIAPGTIVKLNVPVYNLHQLIALPSGSCKLIISIGPNMIIDPLFNLITAPLSNYFLWSAQITGGQVTITGNLIAPLPGDFVGMASFQLKASTLGSSIIEDNFMVTNHNTGTTLVDEDPNNNSASLSYTVTMRTVPVHFTKLAVTKKNCQVHVYFLAENPVNVNRYEIEMSKDGRHYIKLGELLPTKNTAYNFDFTLADANTAPIIFIRIKSIDIDGSYGYSGTSKLNGNCNDKKSTLNIYPNPFYDQHTTLSIRAGDNGVFNGQYNISLIDIGGRILDHQICKVNDARQINYQPIKVGSGIYYLQIEKANSTARSLIKILKL